MRTLTQPNIFIFIDNFTFFSVKGPFVMCEDDDDTCCGLPPKWERRVLLTLVSTLITFCYVSFWILSIVPWRWWQTWTGLFNIALFHTLTGTLIYSYYKSITSSPGYVPYNWVSERFLHLHCFMNVDCIMN